MKIKPVVRVRKSSAAEAALAFADTGLRSRTHTGPASSVATNVERQTMTTQGKSLYCNIKALNPTERAHHKQLTDKLLAARKEIVETEKGYEFQFSPSTVSLAELADWVAVEWKCCPFF